MDVVFLVLEDVFRSKVVVNLDRAEYPYFGFKTNEEKSELIVVVLCEIGPEPNSLHHSLHVLALAISGSNIVQILYHFIHFSQGGTGDSMAEILHSATFLIW